MGSSQSSDIARNAKLSRILSAKTNFVVREGDEIHYLAPRAKGPHYTQFCNQIVEPFDSSSVLRQYSAHHTQLFAEVNLSLASDSACLGEYGDYIQKLRAAVLEKPYLEDCLLYRGVKLSDKEIAEMECNKKFFFPSFTSTSLDPSKCYDKNTILVIKTDYMTKYACSMTEDLSEYYSEEKEVLLACYSAFDFEKIERVNGKNYITLFLDDFSSSFDTL